MLSIPFQQTALNVKFRHQKVTQDEKKQSYVALRGLHVSFRSLANDFVL